MPAGTLPTAAARMHALARNLAGAGQNCACAPPCRYFDTGAAAEPAAEAATEEKTKKKKKKTAE